MLVASDRLRTAWYPAAVAQGKAGSSRFSIWYLLMLLVVAAVLYANAVDNQFTFDDHAYIERNPHIRTLDGIGYLFLQPIETGQTLRGHLYRPFAGLIELVIGTLGGYQPRPFHIANILLYALNGMVLLGLLRRHLDHRLALVAAAVFVFHPIHTEVVASAVGITELLAFQLGISSLWLALHRSPTWWRQLPAGTCFLLAMLSKETAVVYIVVALLAALYLRIERSRWLALAAIYTVPLLIYFALRYHVIGTFFRSPHVEFAFIDNPLCAASVADRFVNAIVILVKYLWLLVWPVKLSADYSFNAVPLVPAISLVAVAAVLVHIVLLAVAWLARRRQPLISLGILIFYTGILPASNLLFCGGAILGERFLYLPSVGLCLVIGALWQMAVTRLDARWPTALLLLLVVAGGIRTADRNRDWASDLTLFTRAVAACPENAKAHYNLGLLLHDRGDLAGSLEHAERAVAIYDHYIDARILLARLQLRLGRPERAEPLLHDSLGLGVEHEDLYVELGNIYIDSGRHREAVELLTRGAANIPLSTKIPYNLALIYMDRHDYAAAEPYLRAAIANGDLPDAHYALGHVALARNDCATARHEMQAARRSSQLCAAAIKYEAFCMIQAGDPAGAGQLLSQLSERQLDPDHRLLLIAILADSGELDHARKQLERMLMTSSGRLCSSSTFPDLCNQLASRLIR
jgi:tetratricopeptide (TPR) repeat protein